MVRRGGEAMEFEDAVQLWAHLKAQYTRLRGSDPDENRKAIPRTTVFDVKQLVTMWDAELQKATSAGVSAESEQQRWRECREQVALLARGLESADLYPANQAFWRCSGRLAIYLEAEKIVPSRWQLFREAVEETIENLPRRLESTGDIWSKYIEPALWISGGFGVVWLLARR
jgi:hypothetical protein